jgi:hypothetical protein
MKRGKLTIRREKTRPKSQLSSLNYGNGIIQIFRDLQQQHVLNG